MTGEWPLDGRWMGSDIPPLFSASRVPVNVSDGHESRVEWNAVFRRFWVHWMHWWDGGTECGLALSIVCGTCSYLL